MSFNQFSLETRVAAAAPAMANAALLLAEGCVFKYTEALNTLYKANNLPCPDMQPVIDMKLGMCVTSEKANNILSTEEEAESNTYENVDEFYDSYIEECYEKYLFNVADESLVTASSNPVEEECDNKPDLALPLDVEVECSSQGELTKSQASVSSDHEDLFDEDEWVPLTTLNIIPSTPILSKIGITNPSPAAYYYLDIMTRNKRIIFDASFGDSIDPFADFDNNRDTVESMNIFEELDFEATAAKFSKSSIDGSRDNLDNETCTRSSMSPSVNIRAKTCVVHQQRGRKRCVSQTTAIDNTGPRSKRVCKDTVPRWRN